MFTTDRSQLLPVKVIGVILLVVSILWGIATSNSLYALEQGIVAADKATLVSLDTLVTSAESQGFVIKEYRNTFITALTEVTSSRKGIQSFITALREDNYPLDPTMFRQLMASMEGGYDRLAADQRREQDMLATLQTRVSQWPDRIVASIGGFPHISLDHYQIVVTDQTRKAGETRVIERPVNPLR